MERKTSEDQSGAAFQVQPGKGLCALYLSSGQARVKGLFAITSTLEGVLRVKLQESPDPAPPSDSILISEAVQQALENYFAQMNGHKVDRLYDLVINEVERPLLECVMYHCGGNQSKAASILGINRGTLRKKLKHYDVTSDTPIHHQALPL